VSVIDEFVIPNLEWAKSLACVFAKRPGWVLDIDDAISVSFIALIETAKRYDPSKGASFRTYAANRIRGAILDEIRSQKWGKKRKNPKKMVSLSRFDKLENAEDSRYIPDVLGRNDCGFDEVETRDLINYLLRQFNEKHRRIFCLYVIECKTLKQIGEIMGLSESRIAQIYKRMIRQIKQVIEMNDDLKNNLLNPKDST